MTAARARAAPRDAAKEPLPVPVSNPDKLYWPDDGTTKLQLVTFYHSVFAKLRPWVEDRLLSLERCPEGMGGQCFYQKEKPNGLPKDTPTKAIQHEKGVTNYVVGGREATHLALANLGCIAVHVWGSRAASPRKPDWVCFDIDPASGKMSDAIFAALKIRTALDALELPSYPKTSGGKGLHVFVPIRVGPDCDDVLGFAQGLGERLAAAYPKELTVESRIAARKGRVYLDAFRNGFAQTVVAPYSVRRRPLAPVSTPLDWSEVKPGLAAADFTLGTFASRLKKKDPWESFWKSRTALGPAIRALRRI